MHPWLFIRNTIRLCQLSKPCHWSKACLCQSIPITATLQSASWWTIPFMMDNSFHDVRLPHTGNDNDYHLLSNNIPIVALGWSGYLSCTEKKNQAHSIRNIIVLLCCAAWMKIEGKRPLVFKSQHSNMKCYWTFQEHFDTQVDKRGKLSVNYMNPAVSGWNGHIFENLENLWKTVQTTHGATNTNAEVLLLLRQGDTYPLISFDIKGTRPLVRLQRGASRGMVLRSGGNASRLNT